MTQNAIQAPPSLQDAADRLKDQIRSGFVDMLTPEQWKAMIQTELEGFLKPRRDPYRADPRPSALTEMCEKAFRELLEEKIRETLKSEPFTGNTWEGRVGEVVKAWLTENQDRLIQSTILQLAGLAAQTTVSAMASGNRGY